MNEKLKTLSKILEIAVSVTPKEPYISNAIRRIQTELEKYEESEETKLKNAQRFFERLNQHE